MIWEPSQPPADVRIPASHVLVHDTTGDLLSRCDLYAVKWHRARTENLLDTSVSSEALNDAREYFGISAAPEIGLVDIPEGPWRRFARVQFIRYRRAGNSGGLFEHEYDPTIDLYVCERPLAFRVALPTGCIVDDRGFVWP